jgi:hypothetical protein
MLEKVTVTNRRNQSLIFEMMENDSGYQISDVEGLDPVEATLVSTSFPGIDGEQYQAAKRGARDLVIALDLEPNGVETAKTLRDRLYSYFMPKAPVSLRFRQDDGLEVDIQGIVESCKAKIWTQEPTANISIRCFEPDFIDKRRVELEGMTVSDSTITTIEYPGTVETGTVLTLNVNRSLPAFTIYNRGEDNILRQLDFSYALLAGDQLVLSSLRGAKGITLIRDGVSSSVLYGRSPQSAWIELFEGDNQFRVYAPGDPVPYILEYVVRYGGL